MTSTSDSVVFRVWLVWTATFLVQIICMAVIVSTDHDWSALSVQILVAVIGSSYVVYQIWKDMRSWR